MNPSSYRPRGTEIPGSLPKTLSDPRSLERSSRTNPCRLLIRGACKKYCSDTRDADPIFGGRVVGRKTLEFNHKDSFLLCQRPLCPAPKERTEPARQRFRRGAAVTGVSACG